MELFGIAQDAQSGTPIAFATVQRLYPDGQNYSAPLVADASGYFNGRVPDTTYSWIITAAGYKDQPVSLQGAQDSTTSTIKMQRSDSSTLPEVVVTPGLNPGIKKTAIITAAVLAAIFANEHYRWIKF